MRHVIIVTGTSASGVRGGTDRYVSRPRRLLLVRHVIHVSTGIGFHVHGEAYLELLSGLKVVGLSAHKGGLP